MANEESPPPDPATSDARAKPAAEPKAPTTDAPRDEVPRPGESETDPHETGAKEAVDEAIAEAGTGTGAESAIELAPPIAAASAAPEWTWPVHPLAGPLKQLDKTWTNIEAKLCAAVLLSEIATLCFWIVLKGLSTAYHGADRSGLVLRATLTAALFGTIAHFVLRPKPGEPEKKAHAVGTTVAVIVGLFAGRLWANAGVTYSTNLFNWLQNASILVLIGGFRGLGTRLTLWLALLGASIATGKGKHINVDVVMRFLSPKLRVPVAVIGWLAAAIVCAASTWGFLDFILVAEFNAPMQRACVEMGVPVPAGQEHKQCDVPMREKLGVLAHDAKRDLFLTGRQISLDVRAAPSILAGKPYDKIIDAKEWNAWMKGADWKSYWKDEDLQNQYMDEASTEFHAPLITVPGGENTRGLLIRLAGLIFPIGLFMITLRFLLRIALALTGGVKVDPDAAHEDHDDDAPAPATAESTITLEGAE